MKILASEDNFSDLHYKGRQPEPGPVGRIFRNIKYWMKGEYRMRKRLKEVIQQQDTIA